MNTSVLNNSNFKNILSSIRLYDKKYPDINEFVLAKIVRYEDTGIYCYLNEYKREALLSFKDASSSKKLKNIKKQVKKGGVYVLAVIGMDAKKGFVDVEKRSIDETEQKYYEDLILFYERVFSVFVKEYYVYNPECSIDDIYKYLKNTLWLHDPKDIKKNICKIHIEPDTINTMYNIDSIPNNNIINNLSKLVKKPSYKHIIKLDVKSISLEGIEDIKKILINLSDTLNIPEFFVYSVPFYYTKVTTEYSHEFNPELYSEELRKNIEEFITENSIDNIGIKIEEIYFKLN